MEPPTTLATRGQGEVDSLSPGWGGGWWGGEGSQIKSRSLSLGTKHPESLLPGALPHSSLPYASCVRGPGLCYLKGRGVGDKSSGTPFLSQAAAFFFLTKALFSPTYHRNVCQLLSQKDSHRGQLQANIVMSLNSELGTDSHHWPWPAGASRLQHAPGCGGPGSRARAPPRLPVRSPAVPSSRRCCPVQTPSEES